MLRVAAGVRAASVYGVDVASRVVGPATSVCAALPRRQWEVQRRASHSVVGSRGAVARRMSSQALARPMPTEAARPSAVCFALDRDWCDHLLFFEDRRFVQGRFGGGGTWEFSSDELRLTWSANPPLGASGPRVDSLRWGARRAEASGATLSLRCLEGGWPAARARPALLFSSVGDQCWPVVREHWLSEAAAAEFDVVLCFYKEPSSPVFSSLAQLADDCGGVELRHSPGMKWPNFRRWVESQGGAEAVADRYDYIWVVDDDVRMPTSEINRMFSLLRTEHPEVAFACPSFDARSDGVWRYFDGHDARYKLRYTDFVECTAPVLKTSMLRDDGFGRCLRAARTGCFLDFCFFPAARRRQDAVAILDAVQCHHPPRGADTPSQMRELQKWEDHKEDDVHFDAEGVPRDWYWFRTPIVFGSIPADCARQERL